MLGELQIVFLRPDSHLKIILSSICRKLRRWPWYKRTLFLPVILAISLDKVKFEFLTLSRTDISITSYALFSIRVILVDLFLTKFFLLKKAFAIRLDINM